MPRILGLSFKRAVRLLLLFLLLALGIGLALFAMSSDFRQQTRTLASLAGLSKSSPSPGPTLRLPIRKRFIPEALSTPAASPEPMEAQDNTPEEDQDTKMDAAAADRNQTDLPLESESPETLEGPQALKTPEKIKTPEKTKKQAPEQEDEKSQGPKPKYSIQAGACREKVHAMELAETLQDEGYQTEVFTDQHANGEIWHKVRIGAFESQSQAEKALKSFQNLHNQNAFLIRIPGN